MVTRLTVLALVALVGQFPPAHAEGTKAAADAWPATRAGQMAKGWVRAFDAGADSMRAFLAVSMAPKSLDERNVSVRVEKYKDLRDQYGRLQLDRVEESADDHVTVKLLDADAKSRTFTFTIQDGPPYKLVSVTIRQPMDGIHGLFRGFHH